MWCFSKHHVMVDSLCSFCQFTVNALWIYRALSTHLFKHQFCGKLYTFAMTRKLIQWLLSSCALRLWCCGCFTLSTMQNMPIIVEKMAFQLRGSSSERWPITPVCNKVHNIICCWESYWFPISNPKWHLKNWGGYKHIAQESDSDSIMANSLHD